jgi:hypothetical protein
MTGETTERVIAAMISAETIGVMIDGARMTTTARSALHHHHQKGATPMVHSNQLTERSTSSLVPAK